MARFPLGEELVDNSKLGIPTERRLAQKVETLSENQDETYLANYRSCGIGPMQRRPNKRWWQAP
jgi:hypothetical protein